MRYARYALISRSVLPFYSNSLYLRSVLPFYSNSLYLRT